MSMPPLEHYLSGLPNLAQRNQHGLRAEDFSLQRLQRALAALGQPQQAYPSLHVAGTNGKGSVSVLCAAALQAQGHRVGLFTSPHLSGALHGIRVNGMRASEAELQASFEHIYPTLAPQEGWTHFEVVVALMFAHFARVAVAVAVVEVGLGGRLDATNVLLPTVSVITPIDYDHTSILGHSLAEIAAHKAGIIKPGVPVVSAPQPAEAAAVIAAEAAAQHAPLTQVETQWQAELVSADWQGQHLRLRGAEDDEWQELHIALLGQHQLTNALTAYAALQKLDGRGLPVSPQAIRAGFAAARWPGRFERLPGEPLTILDGAHSPAAARALRAALDAYAPGQPVVLVLGVSADKDLAGVLEPLAERIQMVYATQSAQLRAMPAGELAERVLAFGLPATAQPQPAAALQAARAACPRDGLVLVAGSVFLVDEVRGYIGLEPSTK
ncbi:MAG TPA: Mur ligase family protein [Anaerolineales bacterium]|nr:Mur ligase family protein [Anaerolineales bacterium]